MTGYVQVAPGRRGWYLTSRDTVLWFDGERWWQAIHAGQNPGWFWVIAPVQAVEYLGELRVS